MWPQVPQAQGLLASVLGVPIDEAVAGLELLAQFRGVSVPQAADAIMDSHGARLHEPRETQHPELRFLAQHLDRASTPLDHPR